MRKDLDSLPGECIDEAGRTTFRQISRRLAQLRHSAVHRLHLGSDEVLEQIRSAHMLTEILHDDDSASKLQAVYGCLRDNILKTKHNTKAMQQEVNHAFLAIQRQREALDRQERQLRESAGKQLSRIADAADQSLSCCMDNLTDLGRLEGGSKKDIHWNKHTGSSASGNCVYEDDIESDEEQLRAELG